MSQLVYNDEIIGGASRERGRWNKEVCKAGSMSTVSVSVFGDKELCVTYKEDLDEEKGGADDDAEQEDHSLGRHDV